MADAIELGLSSFSKKKRLSSLEVLQKNGTLDSDVIQILQSIENVPCTIVSYRNREQFLEDLLKLLQNRSTSDVEREHSLVLRYLLGSLYINFEKFWGPTIRVIVDLLNFSNIQNILLNNVLIHLEETNDIIYSQADDSAHIDVDGDRPDHILHRNFLFQIIHKFPCYIETNSVLFVDQFLRFVQQELLVSPFIEKYTTENLIKDESKLTEDVHETETTVVKVPIKGTQKKSKKETLSSFVRNKQKSKETFLTASQILQSFTNVKLIHRHSELKQLILDLLCCRDNSIQKAAFKCLLAYDDEHIKPYVEKFMKILSDKMIKTELTLFSIDENESEQIQHSHRGELMPVLLRVLFGKMIGKIGKKGSGRDKADLRKTLIMRLIAGCAPEEIMFFFELIFDSVFHDVKVPYETLEYTLSKRIVLTSYVPLNKLHAMLNSLSAYIESVAHLHEELLSYLLKLINIILFYVVKPLEEKDLLEQISEKNVNLLRTLKRTCFNIVTDFFQTFEYYSFNQEEVDFIFKHLIWSSTSEFVNKNYATITPMLKLMESFACHRRYHILFIKRNKVDQEEYLLKHLIDLYSNPKTTRIISKFIASVLANIINPDLDSCDETEGESKVVSRNETLCDKDALIPHYSKVFYNIGTQPIAFGQEILIAFIPIIFERLKRNCQSFLTKKDAEHRIENEELTVLSTLSVYLKDPDQSLLGVELLLTTLEYQKKEALILNTLKTAQVLLRQVQTTSNSSIVSLISNILSFQRNFEQRKELCNLIDILSELNLNLKSTSSIIRLLNETRQSMDNEESADLVKWNEGFQLLFSYLNSLDESSMNDKEVIQDSLVLILHQIGFILNNVNQYEFSIRESCMIFFEKLSRKLRLIEKDQNSNLLNCIIQDILLERYIKKGLRSTNDTVKHTFIGVLRILAKECHDKHNVLSEFHLFCDDQPDLDFWLNIRHIQLHNRSKALARLIANQDIHRVSPKTLSSYFMPIAAGFLFSKTYKSVSSLSENAIKLIGIICRQLNWMTYKSTLNYYLDLLTKANTTYQRTNIRLITEILKNFNFDLTACKEAMESIEENNKLEKRMKKRVGTGATSSEIDVIATDAPVGKRLNPSTARMVYFSVTQQILPRLNSSLHEMTRVEFEHDKKMADYLPEKEEIKRIPIAFAIVQLLNLLPGRHILFRDQLPALILKLSSFLKSKNELVRKVARATLVKIMTFVGPAYMPDFLRVLKQNLDRGFQIHVLNYTVHSVLEKLPLHYSSLDHSVETLVNSSFQEIFGKLAEDKEISQILAKTFEAKKTKSFDTLMILSSVISAEKLDYLMNSIREVLKTSNEPKTVNKISVCIHKVFSGLSKNNDFPLDKLLSFIQLVIEESIPSLKIRQRIEQAECSSNRPRREDRFLISKDQTRDRVKSKINEKGNFHMVVENSLRLLLLVFEKNKIIIKRKEALKRKLDGLIKLLARCLKSSSPRCVMRSLKCIYFIAQAKSDLPNLRSGGNLIVKRLFTLLSLYNGVGMVQGDNLDMISMCFKTLTLLLLKCSYVELSSTQIQALISYIAQDLHDTTRQATAFSALNSLLKKKYNSSKLNEIMSTVAELLITSEEDNVRSSSIKVWETYLLEYKHEGNRLQDHLTKFLRQLDYEYIDGRKSVLKVLNVVVMKFPEQLLRDYFELMFHLLAQRVVNEESKEVRDMVSKLLSLLVQRLPEKQIYVFNKFIIPWASGSSPQLQVLGIKLISLYVESCKSLFNDKGKLRRAITVISDVLERNQIEPTDKHNDENESKSEQVDNKIASVEDKLDYHTLRLFKRLLVSGICDPIESRYIQNLKLIWHNIATRKLCHWYLPVVLTSCELYLIFIKQTSLAESLNVQNPTTDNYLDWNAKIIIRTLCDKFIELLDRADESNQLLVYITECMILLGQLVANSTSSLDFENGYRESFQCDIIDYLVNLKELPNDGLVQEYLPYDLSSSKKRLNLAWMSVKVIMQARKEAAVFRLSKNYRRSFVLQWCAAISQELGTKRIGSYVLLFMMTPVRELTDKGKGKSNDSAIQQNMLAMSEDLLKFIKGLIGVEKFERLYCKVQLHFSKRRNDRKKRVALMKVKDQVRGVKRKLKQNKDKTMKKKKSRTTGDRK